MKSAHIVGILAFATTLLSACGSSLPVYEKRADVPTAEINIAIVGTTELCMSSGKALLKDTSLLRVMARSIDMAGPFYMPIPAGETITLSQDLVWGNNFEQHCAPRFSFMPAANKKYEFSRTQTADGKDCVLHVYLNENNRLTEIKPVDATPSCGK